MNMQNSINNLFNNDQFQKKLLNNLDDKYNIFGFFKNQDSNRQFIILFLMFIIFISINYYFSNKVIISFIPFVFFLFIIYYFISQQDITRAKKNKSIESTIPEDKYPLIYKYSEFLNIFNEINYLNHYNPISFKKALFFTQYFLNIYDFIKDKLQINEQDPQNYNIINNSSDYYKIVLNELMAIIISIPPYTTYVDNIKISQGLLQNTELKIDELQNLFLICQKQIMNFTNNLINQSINSLSSFSYPEDLVVIPNPLIHKDYSPNYNLY